MERETSSHDPVGKMLMLGHDMPPSTTSSVRPANHPSRMLAMIASAACSASSLKDHLQWSNHYSGTWGVHQGHGLLNIANPNPSPAAIATAHAHQQGGGMPEAGEAAALQMLPLPDPPPAAAAAAAPNSREVGPHLAIGGPDLAGARAVVADEAAATALYFHLTNNNRGGCAAATCTGATVSPMKRSFYTMFSDASDDAADDLDTCIVDCTHVEKKRRLTVQQLRALESNFDKENKLEPERKMQLAHELGLQPRQVAVWFQNRRARWKNKQLEKDYDQLKLEYDTLMFERDNLQSQVQLLTTKLQAFEPPGPDGDDIDMHHSNRLKVEEIPASLAPVSGTSGTSAARVQPPSSSAFHHVPLRNTAEEDEATPVDVHARAAESGKGESFLQLPGPGSSGFALSPANSGDLETGMALTEGSTTCATGHSGEVGTMATLADNTSMMGYDMSQVSSPVIKVSSPSDSSMVSTTSLSNTSHVQQPTAQDIHLVAAVDLPSLAVTHVIASEASVISATTFPPCVPDSANSMPTFDSIPADHPPMANPLEALDAATSGPGQHLLAANATSTEAHHHVLHVPYAACPNSQTDHIHHSQLQLQADTTHDLTPGPVSAAVMNQASTSGHGVGVPSRSVVSADNFPFSFADPAASARALQLQGLRRNLSSPSLHQVNHNLCQLNLCPMGLSQAGPGPGPGPALDIAPPCACDGPSASSLSEPATNMHATGISLMRELSGSSINIVDPSPAASASRGVLVNVAGGYAGPRPVGHAHGPLLSSTYQFMKSSHLNNLAKLVIPSMSQAGHGLPLNMGAVIAVSRTVTDYASPQPAAGSMSNVRIFHVPPAAGTGGDANGGGGQPTSTEPLHRPQIPPMQAQPPPQPQAFAHHHPFQQLTYQAAKVEPEPDFVPGLLPQSAGQSSSSQFDLVDSRSGGLPCNWWEV